MRLSKLDAAAHLGLSPSTIDRMIQRGELESEKEPHGTRYKVWVLLDDESGGESLGESSDADGQSSEESPDESPDVGGHSPGQAADSSDPSIDEPTSLRERVKHAEERSRGLEELADYHKKLLDDSEWRYHQLIQQLHLSQEATLALTRALPPAIAEAVSPEPNLRRRRRWWPFGKSRN